MADSFFGATDKGLRRDNNEDAFVVQEVMEGRYIAACVIDGVGGYEGGEVAAALAKDTILEILSYNSDRAEDTLRSALRFANQKIFEEKERNPNHSKMSCVLTAALVDIKSNTVHYAHIGDTRLYLLRGATLVKLTRDHSFVGFLEDSGRLTEEAAMKHPKRNEINRALGFDPLLDQKQDLIETGFSPFLPGDILLLCSDGLSDMVNQNQMTNILSEKGSLEEKTHTLIRAANEAGGKDNITVVLVRNDKQVQQHEATAPASPAQRQTQTEIVESGARTSNHHAAYAVRKRPRRFLVIVACLLLLMLALLVWRSNAAIRAIPADRCSVLPEGTEEEQEHSTGHSLDQTNMDLNNWQEVVK